MSIRSDMKLGMIWAALFAVAACESPVTPGTDEASDVDALASAVRDPGQPVLAFADGTQWGASTLVRTANGVSYNVSTSGLDPGHAYTLWFVVFNNPAGCAFPTPVSSCGDLDVVNPDAVPDMAYAGGSLVGGAGTATFAGSRRMGPLDGSINAPVLPANLANGLVNPLGAEIHLVVHHHGPKLPEYMPDMIKTVDGGCVDAGIPFEGADTPWNSYAGDPMGGYGRRGPNTCGSVQFAVHQP